MNKLLFNLAIVLVLISACGGTAMPTPVSPTATLIPSTVTPVPPTNTPLLETTVPNEIVFEHRNLYPEGIEYDEGGQRFLLSSVTQGTIYQVADDGTIEPFIEDDELELTLGLEIDHVNNRLLVANSSHSEEQAMLGAYDLETGQRIFMVNLSDLHPSGRHMANDVAVDTNGIAYVTDFYAPVIYRVDMEGKVSIFMEDKVFASINGIVAHPDGYLILGAAPNLLLKIPLKEPEVIQIELADDISWFEITDGIILHPDGGLIMVTFPASVIYWLGSDDYWASASLVAKSAGHNLGYGTTVALRGSSVYVIYSHLNRWMGRHDQYTFEIVRVEFKED